MKKRLSILLSIFILLLSIPVFAEPTPAPSPSADPVKQQSEFPELHAEAALLLDMKTGRVLYAKNENERLYPASTTKMLTAIITLEKCNLSDVVTAPSEAIDPITREDSNMGILKGEQLTVEQLLYGMLVYSANDAANCLAVHIAGSISNFADMMNAKAKELGAVNSHFVNPHGFHDDNHYTTASDLAAIARYGMTIPKFREIVATVRYDIPPTNKYTQVRYLSTTNNLISRIRNTRLYYAPAIGIKTGFTSQAGNCLVAAAKKEDTEFLSVLMKCPNIGGGDQAYSFTDTRALFEYAFENYQYQTVAANGDIVSDSAVYEAKGGTRVALTVQDTIGALLPVGTDIKTEVTPNIVLNETIKAPLQQGDILGSVSYTYKGEVIGSGSLIATNSVTRDNVLFILHWIVRILTSPFFLIPLALLAVFIIYIRIQSRRNRKKRRSKLNNYPRYR